MFAMANLTYVGPAQPINEGWDVLLTSGGLKKRELPASPMLTETRDRDREAMEDMGFRRGEEDGRHESISRRS